MNKDLLQLNRAGQSGIGLIEILIAMVLGLFVAGSIGQVFASVRQTNRVHENTSRMQENGRMALEVIARDVRMTDFWGCSNDSSSVVNNLNSGGSGYIDFSAGGIGGTEGGAGVPDTLILRGGSGSDLSVQPPYGPQTSADIKVPAGNGFAQGDIILVSDCSNGDIFQVTNANPDGSGVLVHNTGNAVSPGNYNATNPLCPGGNAHCLSKIYGADANTFSVQQFVYSVGMGSEGQPALFRNGQEFVDGVEDFQVLYGEDTDPPSSADSGIANYYVPADQVADMTRVIGIRFAVVTRSYDDYLNDGTAQNYSVLGTNRLAADKRLRQVYSSTVTIRNRL